MKKNYYVNSISIVIITLMIVALNLANAADIKKTWILSASEWNSIASPKHDGSDTEMANALAKEGWEITQFSMAGIVLKNTGNKHQTKILSINEWNSIAKAKHGGSDTEMANALAKEGWEITQFSMAGIVLKNTGNKHQTKILSINEWNSIAKAKHDGSDTEMANALVKEGWEITQFSMAGIVLKR